MRVNYSALCYISKSNNSQHALYLAGIATFPKKTKQGIQRETNFLLTEIKKNEKNYEEELTKLQTRTTTKKAAIFKYFTTRPNPTNKPEQQPNASDEMQVFPQSNSSGGETSTSTNSINSESSDSSKLFNRNQQYDSSICTATPIQKKNMLSQTNVDR